MRHGIKKKEEVRKMRTDGLTLDQIQKLTLLPRTTIYGWISDIELSSQQTQTMRKSSLQALQEGRIRAQSLQKKKMLDMEQLGKERIGILTERELFIAGVALYWAEGFKNKHENRLGFCNSDPIMVRFYLRWLKECLQVPSEDITVRVTANIAFKDNIELIEQYWSNITDLTREQFTKPFYQETVWKKTYSGGEYYGVLRIHVKKSLHYLHYMKGLIQGMKNNSE